MEGHMPKLKMYLKPNCTSCRKARGLLLENGVELDEHDLGKNRLTAEQLDALIGSRNYLDFLNPRNEMCRGRKMKEHPPSRDEALKFMAQEPNLIRRPIVIRGGQMVLGYDEEALKKLAN
jgi:Spx/MgsR family transcriptional regulator